MNIEEEILVCAVRYALGRRSYIVADVCKHVKNQKDSMSDYCKSILVRDIEEEIERYHRFDFTCGDLCDEKDWLDLLDVLRQSLNKE